MPKPKQDPNLNRVGIRIMSRKTTRIDAWKFGGQSTDGKIRWERTETIVAAIS